MSGVASTATANSSGPPDGRTGAPGELTCNAFLCHSSFPLNSGDGALAIEVPESYLPGETYTIVVDITQAGAPRRWGFELTALDSLDEKAGELASLDINTRISNAGSGRQYIKQTSTGTAFGQPDGTSWSFEWTAPQTDVGDITFYAAGNAADGTFSPSNDWIYTQEAVVPLAAPDSDEDGIPDAQDNCVFEPNPDQRDTNLDGYGNLCDADFNNDATVNFLDLGLMKSVFFSDDPDADLNGDGSVNFLDLGLMKVGFFQPPGPSGLPCAGSIPCPAEP